MNKFFYNLFLWLYKISAKIISPFNAKAKLWVDGRKDIFEKLTASFSQNTSPVIWIHCASLGEFEQGRPLIESIKQKFSSYKTLLTFFSPSGYEVRKNYAGADFIFYMPLDSKQNAEKFLSIAKPSLVLFVKYEFWFYYLNEIKKQNIPLLLVSAFFRESQPFFKWYGSFHKKMLDCFTYIFVQNENSLKLLQSLHFSNVMISGDTRFDRVTQIANNFQSIDIIEKFYRSFPVIVAGSTWLEDDEELDHFVNHHPEIRFIIAPHDIQKERIDECKKLYKNSITLSSLEKSEIRNLKSEINTLIIDNIGMLSRLYAYATICYVGGGFGGDGVHNTLEAAVYNKPIVFGPEYSRFIEPEELIDAGGAFTVEGQLELEQTFSDLLNDKNLYETSSKAAGNYVKERTGASQIIMNYIQEKRLLTN